jgi:hypothetical protein
MTRLPIPGGLFCDALPDGTYVCVLADATHVQTHQGDISTIANITPGYVRVADKGVFVFAGQASDASRGALVTWSTLDGWHFNARVPYGANPVIYDHDGLLHVATQDLHIGSLGYRYVDVVTGVLVTGDSTKSHPSGLVADWTDIGDGLIVGACNVVPGVVVLETATLTLRMIEPGDFVRMTVNRVGNQVAISIIKPGGAPALILQTSMTELITLPVIQPAPPSVSLPTISKFLHPVLVAPFKDPTHASGQPVSMEELGVLLTPRDPVPSPLPKGQRLTYYWDQPTRPVVPPWLRPWDLFGFEFYREVYETLQETVDRWRVNLLNVLSDWTGSLFVIPQFYCQGAPPPNELWTVQQVVDALIYLTPLVNLSPRIQVVAPFCWDRLNGMTAHPELREMLKRVVAASPGLPTLPEIPLPPPPPPTPVPQEPSMPQLTFSLVPLKTFNETPVFDQIVEVEPHPDGHGLSALKFPDGFASWSGAGGWDSHKPTAGAWERFLLNGPTMTAYRGGASTPIAVFACQDIVVL